MGDKNDSGRLGGFGFIIALFLRLASLLFLLMLRAALDHGVNGALKSIPGIGLQFNLIRDGGF